MQSRPPGRSDPRCCNLRVTSRSDLYILLSPPDGTALLKAPAREIKDFLQGASSPEDDGTSCSAPRGWAAQGSRSIELCSRAHPGAGTLNLCFR
jgi:hypothetical protein